MPTPGQTPRPPPCATLSRVTTGTAESESDHSLQELKWQAAGPIVHMILVPVEIIQKEQLQN